MPDGIHPGELVAGLPGGIATCQQGAESQVLVDVVHQPSGEQVGGATDTGAPRFDIEHADGPWTRGSQQLDAAVHAHGLTIHQAHPPRIERQERVVVSKPRAEGEQIRASEKKRRFSG
ncbi:hypothetical protein UU5_07743 [Rhodanobacter sp. 115]|nr:hypothetical protein UU5_07743 [Rhodanobacter sp. 115]